MTREKPKSMTMKQRDNAAKMILECSHVWSKMPHDKLLALTKEAFPQAHAHLETLTAQELMFVLLRHHVPQLFKVSDSFTF